MNRRHFLGSIAGAVAGFTILPPATTYERIWQAARPDIVRAAEMPHAQWGRFDFFIDRETAKMLSLAIHQAFERYNLERAVTVGP